MRIRYTEDVAISFDYPQHLRGSVDIPPLIFIVFVENAFKHGVGRKRDSFIHIDVTLNHQTLQATICNSVHPTAGGKKGIGLENVHRRLEHIFGDNYSLDIEQTEEKYCVNLKIPVAYES